MFTDTWHYVGASGEPAYENGWQEYHETYIPTRFKKINDVVHIQGIIKGGAVGYSGNTWAFTLPEGYRNSKRLIKTGQSNNTKASVIRIEPDGKVRIAIGSNVWQDISHSFALDD